MGQFLFKELYASKWVSFYLRSYMLVNGSVSI